MDYNKESENQIVNEFKPCPECDGWLMAYANRMTTTDIGTFLVARVWCCTTCGYGEEKTTTREVVGDLR